MWNYTMSLVLVTLPCRVQWPLVLVLSLVVCVDSSMHESAQNERWIKDIHNFINKVMQCRNIPGLAVAIVRGERLLLERGYGMLDLTSRRPATPLSLFPIASNTKAFTSTLLAMLLEENKTTTWDTPVKQIIGHDFELYNELLTEQVSLRDLLAHKTGIPDYFLPLMAVYPKNETRERMVWRLRYHKPIYPFRTKFRYNNYMYMLAGYVAEVLGGASWEELVRKRILEPLGMTSTTFIPHLQRWPDLATSYVELQNGQLHPVDKELIRQTHVLGPAGSIVSTATDMARWLQFHLRRGRLPDRRELVRSSSLEETYTEQMPSPSPMLERDMFRPTYPVDDVHMAYDMGWMTNVYRGYKRVWHSGGLTTYKSQVWFYPQLDLGLYIVCNGPPRSATTWALINILQYVTDTMTDQEHWMNTTTACSFPQPWGSTKPTPVKDVADDVPPADVGSFVGTYSHPGFGDLHISRESQTGPLRLQMGQYLDAHLLYNATEDTFYTNLTGKYWYSTYRIPLRFSRSQPETERVDVVYLPLHSPWADVEPFPFARGRAELLNIRDGAHHSSCHSRAATTSYRLSFVIYALFIVVVKSL